ncbi:MAG: dihydroxyacetone kinase subunit DhaL [Corynebacterium sp.]|nr:dihydroxyacetone kinase subunit DhaL [Corynebacterium sp.]
MDTAATIAWIRRCATTAHDHREELIDLDRNIGDADHGANLDRGFQAVQSTLTDTDFATPAEVLKSVAKTLISTVGGASGPLLGTAFLRAAKAVDGKDELTGTDIADLLAAAAAGIEQRGKAEPGDKTMLDAWGPAAEAAAADPEHAWEAAAAAAAQGALDTKEMIARKGRASYLGERSQGHIDPGAQSTAYLLAAAVTA